MVTWGRRRRDEVARGPVRVVRQGGSVIAVATACTVLVGCAGAGVSATDGGGGSSLARARIYDSVTEMADDSDLIVSGTAGGQRVVAESPGSAMTSTLTDLAVDDVVLADDATAAGSTVVVRQVTTAEGWTSSEPATTAPLSPASSPTAATTCPSS